MSRSLLEYRLEKKFQQRLYAFMSLIFVVAITFIIQLGNLQLIHGVEYRAKAKQFVSRKEFMAAPRGLIYDRNFKPGDEPLVQNIKFVDLVIYPARFKSFDEGVKFLRRFCSVMGRDLNDYKQFLNKTKWRQLARKNESITLIKRITHEEQERLAAFRFEEKYGAFIPNHLRYYTMGPAMAHVTGYIGLPSDADLRKKLAESYQTLGKSGIEKQYDSELRGRDGLVIQHKITHSEEQVSDTQQGNNLVLTIDRKVQAVAYRSLIKAGRRGTAVAMNAGTGEIIAMVSNPSFDPNILSSGNREQRRKHLKQIRMHKAFQNRALQIKTPPASTFKPLVALAALEAAPRRDISAGTSFACYGRHILKATRPGVPNAIYNCWTAGHGHNNIEGALAHSCNVYFYQLGYHIGSKPIIRYAREFGLDKTTGIDLPGEIKGRVPDSRWKKLTFGNRWYDGDTLNLAIGQGFLQTTPMEMLVFFGALVNRGKLMRPYVVKEVRDPDNRLIKRVHPANTHSVPISPANLQTIQNGLRAVVTRGTSRKLTRYAVPMAGKTGTAQTRSSRTASSHAWFVGYAPFDAPPEETIVVSVFIEHGQGGSAAAAPVAGEILNAAFADWTPLKTRELQLRARQRAGEFTTPTPGLAPDNRTPGTDQPAGNQDSPDQTGGTGAGRPGGTFFPRVNQAPSAGQTDNSPANNQSRQQPAATPGSL